MKVLIFTQMYPSEKDPHNGTFVYDEVSALRDLVDAIKVLYFNTKESRLNYFRVFPQFNKLVREFKPDIVHCHHTFCVLIAWAAGCRNIVLTFHEGEYLSDLPFLDRIRREGPTKVFVHSKWFKRFCLRKAVHIFDVTGALVAWPNVTSPYVPGVNPKKFFPLKQAVARQRLGWKNKEKVILFPGKTTNPVKRFDIAEKVRILVESQLKAPVKLVPLANIPHEEVIQYICASDVMLLVSDYEASPMVLKEALACGLPCVAFDVGDARSVLMTDPQSVVVSADVTAAAMTVTKLLDSPAIDRTNQLACEFTVGHGAAIINQVYRKLLSI